VTTTILGILFGGILLGSFLFLIFLIFDPKIALNYLIFILLPTLLVWQKFRYSKSLYFKFIPLSTVIIGFIITILIKPLTTIYPEDWILFVFLFAIPFGILIWTRSKGTPIGPHRTIVSSIPIFLSITTGLFLAPLLNIPPKIGVLYVLFVITPAILYAISILLSNKKGSLGLLFPILIIALILLSRIIMDVVGASIPLPWIDLQFITSSPSRFPEDAGLFPALVGSIFIVLLVGIFALIFGIGAALYLEEYAPVNGAAGLLTRIIRINIYNLAGVPSVVYGLLGLAVFINLLGYGFGTVAVASMTLSLLILPIVIISSQEAIRAVPESLRLASYGLGATKWQTIRTVVLPQALAGILTGIILSMSRALGETAPLLMIGVPTTVFKAPSELTDKVSAMPLQVFNWAFSAKPDLRGGVAAAGIILLLFVLLSMNAIAILLRNKYQTEK
jgi:phosphate transport system permease protein